MINSKIQIRKESIGRLISANYFIIPPYQRPYTWGETQVRRLLADILLAFKEQRHCFLSAIVVADEGRDRPTVIDGGQRIITISLLIAAIRSYFLRIGDEGRATEIERSYLSSRRDLKTMKQVPHTILSQDNDVFFEEIIANAGVAMFSSTSGQLLRLAAATATEHIESLAATSPQATDILIDYLEFIRDRAEVIWITDSDQTDALTLVEKLATQGLAFGYANPLRSYLFSVAGVRTIEVQQIWEEIDLLLTLIENSSVAKNMIRSHWLAHYGYSTEKNLLADIKTKLITEQNAIDFCASLAEDARYAVMLLNPDDVTWKSLSSAVQGAIKALNTIDFGAMQPLLLAVAGRRTHQREKILKRIVSWSVRLIVTGNARDEQVAQKISEAAIAFSKRKIHTLKELNALIEGIIPNNKEFRASFGSLRIEETPLIRYYLTELEVYARRQMAKGEMGYASELMPHSSTDHVNIEHVLPENAEGADWVQFTTQEKRYYLWRLGNMALLLTPKNSEIGNAGFSIKKQTYALSDFKLTQDLATYADWTPSAIEARQNTMAKIAPKVWRVN